MSTPDPAPTDLAAAEALLATHRTRAEFCAGQRARAELLAESVAAAMALVRREGREAGLQEAAERVRAQARRFDPIVWGRLADEIAALPPPGEGG